MLDTLVAALSATGVGFASALIPVINAELVVLSFAVSASTPTVVVAAVAVAVGQTCGKLVIFECARRTLSGRRWSRLTRRSHTPQRPTQGWQARAIGLLESRGSGSAVVLASATTGLPPLLLVSAVAGAARMRRLDFAVLPGRSQRTVPAHRSRHHRGLARPALLARRARARLSRSARAPGGAAGRTRAG